MCLSLEREYAFFSDWKKNEFGLVYYLTHALSEACFMLVDFVQGLGFPWDFEEGQGCSSMDNEPPFTN